MKDSALLEPISIAPQDDSQPASLLNFAYAPIVIATVGILCLTIASIVVQLTTNHAQTPWESAILVDGWRASHGMPVYESREKHGHATHLYGALASQTIGLFFRVLPPNIYIGRLLTLCASTIACTILLLAFVDRKKWFDLFVGAGLLISLHYRCRAYFTATRPDMIALLFATLSMFCMFAASRAETVRRFNIQLLLGTLLIVVAFFYKQTYSAFAVVPAIALFVVAATRGSPKLTKRQIAIALLPNLMLGMVGFTLKWFAPNVYFYMVAEAAMYSIPKERIAAGAIALLTLSPLFFVSLIAVVVDRTLVQIDESEPDRFADRTIWLLTACLIGGAAGVVAFAKRGGTYNSLLLGWMPMTVFVAATIGPMMRRVVSNFRLRSPAIPFGVSCVVAGLMVVTVIAVPASDKWNWKYSAGGNEYPAVVAEVARLDGVVICPDDPMIPLIAKRQVGRSLEAELDANGRVGFSPGLIDEIEKADWMVLLQKQSATPQFAAFDDGRFSPAVMSRFGYRRVLPAQAPFNKTYSLWKHDATGAARDAKSAATKLSTTKPVSKKKRPSPDRP